MHKTLSVTVLSSLLAVGGGAALAESGGQASSSSKAQTTQPSGQAGSRANTQGPMGFEEEQIDVPMTVQRIDKKNRDLVLQAPDGTQNTVNVPQGTPGFDSLKKGDTVELEYFEAAVVEPPGNAAKNGSSMNDNGNNGADHGKKRVRAIHKVNNTKNQNGAPTSSGHSNTNGNSHENQ